ncbi:MAG TPA: choice-of-anchor D domain-containing protein [Solirubrobacterales bacterium]|nr:choice-of-anchor D domain-containing protein [Solirubrobacterales bacterium]
MHWRKRESRIWTICALLVIAIGAPTAEAATTSWEFDTPSYDFGEAPAGGGLTESHEFQLMNTGDTSITISQTVLGLPEKEALAVTESACLKGLVLEPGSSCRTVVAFGPITSGPKTGYLKFKSLSEDPPPAEVRLEGEGFGPPIGIEAERLEFGSIAVGATSPVQTITVENRGSSPLRIYGVSAAGWDYEGWTLEYASPFHLAGGSCKEGEVLTAFADCTIEALFTPSKEGSFGSIISISDNASPGSPQTVQLTGKGVAPPPPTSISVGAGPGTSSNASASSPSGQRAKSPPAPPHCGRGRRLEKFKGRYHCVRRMPKHHHRRRSNAA